MLLFVPFTIIGIVFLFVNGNIDSVSSQEDATTVWGEAVYANGEVKFPVNLIHFVHQPHKGFEFATPKPIDQIPASSCSESYCIYHILVFGWFWEPRDPSEAPYFFDVSAFDGNWKSRKEPYLAVHTEDGYLSLELRIAFYAPLQTLVTDLQV